MQCRIYIAKFWTRAPFLGPIFLIFMHFPQEIWPDNSLDLAYPAGRSTAAYIRSSCIYRSDIFKYVFLRIQDLRKHERKIHLQRKTAMERVIVVVRYSDDLKYECLLCKERFSQKRFLNDHLRFDHDEYKHKVGSSVQCFFLKKWILNASDRGRVFMIEFEFGAIVDMQISCGRISGYSNLHVSSG